MFVVHPTLSYMRDPYAWSDVRRITPRVGVDAFCWEVVDGKERTSAVLDLSPEGIRLERPYVGGATPSEIQIELEVPEVDEIVWARGAVCYDVIRQLPRAGAALGLLVRTTGIRLAAAASRDYRLLRDYVFERQRARALEEEVWTDLVGASCYSRA